MGDRETRAVLERHWSDIEDQDVVHEIYHDDVVVEFPQRASDFWGAPTCGRCARRIRLRCPPP